MNQAISFNQVVDRVWREHRLFSVMLELTYDCNLDCAICYNDVNLRGKLLSIEQYQQLLQHLADMGVLNLTLTGGEPLAHPDFFQIGSLARKLGFVVRIKTNGHALRETVARRIQEEIDPYNLDISLHGATPTTHDRQTRIAGSFALLMQNFEILKNQKLRFRMNSPVTRVNEEEIEGMVAIADKYGAHIHFDSDITPRDDGDQAPLMMAPTQEGIRRAIEWNEVLVSKHSEPLTPSISVSSANPSQRESHFHPVSRDLPEKQCGAGSSSLTIDPFGTVYPCVQWRQKVGNLHDQSVMEIWKNSASLKDIRLQNIRVKHMTNDIEGAEKSSFCAGRAVQETGKPVQFYPLAELMIQLHQDFPE